MSAEPDVEWILPADATAGAWAAGLPSVGELRRVDEQTFCWRVLDTFDQRLLAAGWMLAIDPVAGCCLILRERSRTWHQVPWAASEPRWAADLDGLPEQATLARLIGLRALLPQFKLRHHRQTWISVTEEPAASAEFQWFEECWSRVGDPEQPSAETPLSARLRVKAPKGSRKRLRELGAAFRQAGWVPADRSPYAEAVASVETPRPDSTGKRVVITDPELRADATVKRILRGLFDAQLRNEAGALAETDTEFLHDYRIAVRRARALLGQMGRVFPAGVTARFGRQFAELAAVTGPARDWDVFLLALPHLDARLPEAMRGQLDPVRALVVERARAAHARLNARLRSAAHRRFVETWTAFLDKPVPRRPSAEHAVAPIGELASRRIWKLYRRVLREGRAITDQSPAEALHDLRKTAKKLRYQMECFQDLYDAERLALLLRHLKKLQNLLGEFQDASVQIVHLRDLAEVLGRQGASLDSLLAVGALLAILHDDQARQRRHLADVFDTFASHGHRKQFRRLFRQPPVAGQADGGSGAG